MSNDNNTIIPDDIISTINDFKRSKKEQTWKNVILLAGGFRPNG